MLKSKNSKVGAYTTDNVGEVSIAVLTIVEEVGHSLGHLLMVVGVRDEVFPRVIDTFVVEQGAGGEAVDDLIKGIVREAG